MKSSKDKFCNALRFLMQNDNYKTLISEELMSEIKENNVTPSLIFEISAIFPRDSFKISYLTNGYVALRIKQSFIEPKEMLKKAEVLGKFHKAMEECYSSSTWYNQWN